MLLDNEIRILDILPYGTRGPRGPLECEVRVENLSDCPVYDTLSYRWGDPGSKRYILVDNHEFFVTETLFAALLRLRQKETKQSIWIDQLCIDQSNLIEKAIQVRLMGEVYSKCNQCFIWMEEIDNSIPLAHVEAIIEMLSWMADNGRSLPVPACLASPSDFQGPCKALNSIGPFEHPWWHRIWTVQEAIIPLKKSLLWGPIRLSWDTLSSCANIWTTVGAPIELKKRIYDTDVPSVDYTVSAIFGWLFCNVVWVDEARKFPDHPIMALLRWNRRNATDLRDKVFGLLGLISSDVELYYTSRCDYTTPHARVHTAFTLDMILHDRGLGPLVIQLRKPLDEYTKELPTWVGDMSDGEFQIKADGFYLFWGYEQYSACASEGLDEAALTDEIKIWNLSSQVLNPTLGLTGVAVDTLVSIGPKLQAITMKDSVQVAETLRSWLGMARRYHKTIDNGLSGDDLTRTFYRVLVGDRIRNSEQEVVRKPSEQDYADIAQFVNIAQGKINGLWFWDRYVGNQAFFITKDGTMGMGNFDVKVGDEVWVFGGGKMPLAIRKIEGGSEDDFNFVCCCYFDGVMDGEIYSDIPRPTMGQRRTIRLQ
ncbi:hypothetical protein VTL71DRAFT_1116 [Oculimacula yallundae]|uniref:Heterokaryon incompatibility domain-containing protein n=1 Tax=Oculimacula yallundae TaxID=86028 RepID=A0ABR4D1Y3_9HELO